MSVLVRLGWLPLEFQLALNACCWYLRIVRGDAGVALKKLAGDLFTDTDCFWNPAWSRTIFFKPAHDLLHRLNGLLSDDIDIFKLPISAAKVSIKEAMFLELGNSWNSYKFSAFSKIIHPEWIPRRLNRKMLCKRTNVCYHNFAVGRGLVE